MDVGHSVLEEARHLDPKQAQGPKAWTEPGTPEFEVQQQHGAQAWATQSGVRALPLGLGTKGKLARTLP